MAEAGLLLAWDTCTGRGTLAAGDGERVLFETEFDTVKGHTGWLMPLVDRAVRDLGAGPGDIRALAVGVGPGNFTGVKVGVTTAKLLALALGVPLLGTSTLDILAESSPRDAGAALAVVNARRGMVYAALYDVGGSSPRRLTEYAVVTPGEAAGMAAGRDGVTVVGEATDELVALLEGRVERVVRGEVSFPRAAGLLAILSRELADGRAGDAVSVVPMYLRKPV